MKKETFEQAVILLDRIEKLKKSIAILESDNSEDKYILQMTFGKNALISIDAFNVDKDLSTRIKEHYLEIAKSKLRSLEMEFDII